MANHLQPTLTSTYSNFVSEMDARFDDLAFQLDPAVTTATNVPTNSIRWSSASNKWQKYNGSAWNDLATTYAISISGNAATATNGVVTTGTYINPSWITQLAGSKISGAITGNAGTASKLETPRNINGVAFDGSAAISVNLGNSLTFNNGGAGSASGIAFNGDTATTISYNSVGAPSISGANATGTWSISISGSSASTTGNAASATNLAGGAAGRIPFQGGVGTTGFTTVGTSGQVLISNGAGPPTWFSKASTNTVSTIVQRDASGNFAAGTITATTFSGAMSSTSTATTQTAGDNSTKIATTAFVQSALGGGPTGLTAGTNYAIYPYFGITPVSPNSTMGSAGVGNQIVTSSYTLVGGKLIINCTGTVRVFFTSWYVVDGYGQASNGYSRVYKNGVAVGTEIGGGNFTTGSFDIAVVPGDVFQLYARSNAGTYYLANAIGAVIGTATTYPQFTLGQSYS
jgi:hypothetical protein